MFFRRVPDAWRSEFQDGSDVAERPNARRRVATHALLSTTSIPGDGRHRPVRFLAGHLGRGEHSTIESDLAARSAVGVLDRERMSGVAAIVVANRLPGRSAASHEFGIGRTPVMDTIRS
ncbi:hypothetical protein [Nonomuraea rosea]|uniref:hypothetical protein n=1 Tax=Nonomuraea rosea TaxID=638574 RepID=UPI0031F02F8C